MLTNNRKSIHEDFYYLHENYNYFLILDGSAQENKIPAIIYQLEQNPRMEPLFLHTPYEMLQLSGPLLVQVARNSPLLRWYFADSNGETGILLYAAKTIGLAELAAHLRPYIEAVLPVRQCYSVFMTRAIFAVSGPALTVESATFSLVRQQESHIRNRMHK